MSTNGTDGYGTDRLRDIAASLHQALHRIEQELRRRGVDSDQQFFTGTHPDSYACPICGTPKDRAAEPQDRS